VFVTFHPGVTLVSASAGPTALWGVFQHHPHCGHCCPSHARAATVYHATHAASGDSLFYTSDYIILIIIQIGWHVGGWQQLCTGSSSGLWGPATLLLSHEWHWQVETPSYEEYMYGHQCHLVCSIRETSFLCGFLANNVAQWVCINVLRNYLTADPLYCS